LSVYYQIKELLARGEIVPEDKCPLLSQTYHRRRFVDWLEKAKPDLVKKCPVTGGRYLGVVGSIDDLVDLPDCWKTLEEMFGESTFLRSLILSPKVRAIALAHAV
jgi:hypothetical protein